MFVRFDGIRLGHLRVRTLTGRIDAEVPEALEAAVMGTRLSGEGNLPVGTGIGTDPLDGEHRLRRSSWARSGTEPPPPS